MEEILESSISTEEIKKFEEAYQTELKAGPVTDKTKFEYAWCLVQSDHASDIRRGIILLNELCRNANTESARDYMYYLAIGHARVRDYGKANDILNLILRSEPTNNQVLELQKVLKKKLHTDALLGIAKAGGAVAAVGAVIAVGATVLHSLARK